MEIRDNSKINLCFIFNNLNIRRELSRPYGILFVNNTLFLNFIYKSKRLGAKIITVGDYVSHILEENNVNPFLEIIDGKTKRTIKQHNPLSRSKEYKILNEAGVIRLELFDFIKNILKKDGGVIFVDGEEDLLVIPAVLGSDDGDLIIYGQPNSGAVVIIVNEMIRWRVKDLLEKTTIGIC
ncbi:DUF359 domain-containing protein [Sulfolobus tengchongensis]|uniref:GTP-dependent dephospho-CoA kinase n=1 Tax=Sulfolobus tengchongensis TaxID=207809 RepID=A0AAX4L0C9_9CREN